MKPSPANRTDAFTLIELLVVVAIIAVLASILMPTIGVVRSQARAVACRSNMNQLYTGLLSYAGDFHGHLPWNCNMDPGSGGGINVNAWGENWGQTLAVHLEVRLGNYGHGPPPPGGYSDVEEPVANRSRLGIFNCPENLAQHWQMALHGTEDATSYSGNGWGDLSMPWDAPWGARFFSGRVAALGHKDELMAFWDGTYYQSEAWQEDGLGTVPYRGIGTRGVRYAHMGRANIMFADGHSETSTLIRSAGSGTAVPVSSPMRAASWTNGKAWWGAD